jgi:hypothetical protein
MGWKILKKKKDIFIVTPDFSQQNVPISLTTAPVELCAIFKN